MKKLLFMFATAALVLSACSSEDDIVQGGGSLAQLGASDGALSFDVYTASATKAGDPTGVMNTDKLKTPGKGFGVFATYQDNKLYSELSDAEKVPNFMFNQQVKWSESWTYSPLKYWPNETTNDSQTEPASSTGVDRLSFFAYAPYVNLTKAGTMITETPSTTTDAYVEDSPTTGILAITKEDHQGDPLVEWKANTENLDNQVDLLWGVAPYGMSYQSVYPSIYIDKTFGQPLLDLVKPDKDQKIKFLFQHALSRIGISVVSAIDQIAAGDDGGVYSNAETRVLIKSVEVYGNFGTQGVLNLNNTSENVANWIGTSIATSSVSGEKLFEITATNGNLNADLRYDADQITAVATSAENFAKLNTGVLPSETPLFAQGADPSKIATGDALNYAYGKALYTKSGNDYVRATTTQANDVDAYTKDGNIYTQKRAVGGDDLVMNGTVQYYTLGLPAATDVTVENTGLIDATEYYYEEGTAPNKTYTKITAGATYPVGKYYLASGVTESVLAGAAYTGECYTSLVPRYFMVIPTAETPVKVKITYAVVTKDESLTGHISNVENKITKETSLTLQSGKSYNLKLILGLTSVKLDATVADWQVDGSNEVYLPQNAAE